MPLGLGCLASIVLAGAGHADGGNRLAFLDSPNDPYFVGLNTARLAVPQWVGEPGIDVVYVASIDDLSAGGTGGFESFLRPILNRMKQVDGRAPVSIFATSVNPTDPQIQSWLAEGLTIESHTSNHPCPAMMAAGLNAAKATYDASIDNIATIPGTDAVAFRGTCLDSMNTTGPRYMSEIFNKTTPNGNYLQLDSSVMSIPTEADPDLPPGMLLNNSGEHRLERYLPRDRGFQNYIQDYTDPYVVGKLAWQLPVAVPSDWEAQHHHGSGNPQTGADMKLAFDVAAAKQSVFTHMFHPNDWAGQHQILDVVDHAATEYAGRVKFLNTRDVVERLTANVLGGQPLRAANGQDNGARVLDINGDGYMDAIVGNENLNQTRIWSPASGTWITSDFPVDLVTVAGDGERTDAGVRFGVLRDHGMASMIVDNGQASGVWHFDGAQWQQDPNGLNGLDLDGPVRTAIGGIDNGVRLRDIDGDGVTELLVGNPQQSAVFSWQPSGGWQQSPHALPEGSTFVDAQGRDAGMRFVDLNDDGHADAVFSNSDHYSVDLFDPSTGHWSDRVASGFHSGAAGASRVPPIVRADGTNNGAWFQHGHMFVQNEETAGIAPSRVIARTFSDLVGAPGDPNLATITGIAVFRDVPGSDGGVDNTRSDSHLAFDGNSGTWSYLTPAFTDTPQMLAMDLGSLTNLNRIRVDKFGDTDGAGGSSGTPGIAPVDQMDLQLMFTTDAGPLSTRTFLPVTGLTNGFGGVELIDADSVAGSLVDNDRHEGVYSLTFDTVAATGLALMFSRDAGDTQDFTHYRAREIELFDDALQRAVVDHQVFTPPTPGSTELNGRGDEFAAIDGVLGTSSFLTPSGTTEPHTVALEIGQGEIVDRLRIAKQGDLDGTSAGAPGIEPIDNMDLEILYTTDNGPLEQRTYLPVRNLISGIGGSEQIDADNVDPLTASVDNDHHDFATDGWFSLTFDAVEATALAVRFARDADDSASWVHYQTLEFEIYRATLTGDFNGDGVVDVADYTVWRDAQGQEVVPGSGADASGNGIVDADDYDLWRANFGARRAAIAPQGTNVPEPTALWLVGGLVAAESARRRSVCASRRDDEKVE